MCVVAEIYFVAFDEELNGKKFNMLVLKEID